MTIETGEVIKVAKVDPGVKQEIIEVKPTEAEEVNKTFSPTISGGTLKG